MRIATFLGLFIRIVKYEVRQKFWNGYQNVQVIKLPFLSKESEVAPFAISFHSKTQTTQNYFRAYAAVAKQREFQCINFGLRTPMAGNFTILQKNIFCF